MEKFTEIFKKFKTVDIIIVAGVILALIVGFLTYKNFRQTAAKQISQCVSNIQTVTLFSYLYANLSYA